MDASTYLRRKKEAMTTYIHRTPYLDAGLRTEVLQKNAAAVTPQANPHIVPNTCCIQETGTSSQTAAPCCKNNDRSDLYTTPYITLPCCPIPYLSTTYLSPCKVLPYQATPAQQSEASARVVRCCPSS